MDESESNYRWPQPDHPPPSNNPDDWRSRVPLKSRHRIVHQILNTLKNKKFPISGQEGCLDELRTIAVKFEDFVYSTANSKPAYRREISMKMFAVENGYEEDIAGLMANYPAASNRDLMKSAFIYPLCPSGQVDSTALQEETYRKISSMKDKYLPEIREMHQKASRKMQQVDSLPQQPKTEQLEKLKIIITMLERVITFLLLSKNEINPSHSKKLGSYEKQIMNFLNVNKPRKGGPQMQPGQVPPNKE